MQAGALKKFVVELKSRIESEKHSNAEISFVARLTTILDALDDEEELTSTLIAPINELIDEFWDWALHNLPDAQWQESTEIAPWLDLQKLLVNERLLTANSHHPVVYLELKNRYNQVDNNALEINKLLPLLIRCSRMLGYARPQELDDYPLGKLSRLIQAKKPQEKEKLDDILFYLRTTFYLIHRYCTAEQLALLPFLIHFRTATTDEERRSELAIFNCLNENIIECIQFFLAHKYSINMRSLQKHEELKSVNTLIPSRLQDFIAATNEYQGIYFFIQQIITKQTAEELDELVRLLETDFTKHPDQSYTGAQQFAHTIKRHLPTLTEREAILLHNASYLFCLEHYKIDRKEDPLFRHSALSLSTETKQSAVEKKQLSIRGIPVAYSFFEKLALKQGRLKSLVESFETPTVHSMNQR